MTIRRPTRSLFAILGPLTAMCLTACSAGIDVGQVTGSGSGTGTGGGSGGDAGLLELDPSTLDMGTAVVNTTVTQTTTITNASGAEIDGITATVSGANASWFALSGVPAMLAAGGQARVSISFGPTAVASPAEALVTVSATGMASATLALTATSLPTALELDPTTIDFGYVALNNTAIACTTVTNVANVAVTITGVQGFEDDFYQLAATDNATPPNPINYPLVIAAGSSAEVCFELTPPITADWMGQATLLTNDPGGVNPVIPLTGWGGGPQIFCTPQSLDFGPTAYGSAPSLQILCFNNGTAIPTADLMLGAVTSSSSAFSAQVDPPADAGGLLPGQSAVIDVTYRPSGAAEDTGTLTIASNGGQGQPVSISLSGSEAAATPDAGLFDAVQVQSTTLEFGYVPLGTTGRACTTVANVAQVGLAISGFTNFLSVGGAFSLALDDDATPPNPISLPANLAAGASLRLCFDLTPPITQEYLGQVTLLVTTPNDVDPVLSLAGWGGGPQISCTSPNSNGPGVNLSMEFGTVPVGTTSTVQLVCTNSGTAIPTGGLTLGPLVLPSGPFSAQFETGVVGVVDGGLAPGQSAMIDVSYQPVADGGDFGTLQVDDNGGQGQPVSVSLSGSGS